MFLNQILSRHHNGIVTVQRYSVFRVHRLLIYFEEFVAFTGQSDVLLNSSGLLRMFRISTVAILETEFYEPSTRPAL